MKARFKFTTVLIIIMCMALTVLSGCNIAPRRSPNQPGATPSRMGATGTNPGINTGTVPNTNTRIMQPTPGTGTTATPGAIPGTTQGTTPNIGNTNMNRLNQQTTQPMIFDRQRSENIKSKLSSLKDIDGVNVIVTGNTALVGYKMKNASKDAARVKGEVDTKIKQTDSSIKTILSTDAADTGKKIQQLASDIVNGKSGTDISNRFNQLVQTINPMNKK